MAGGTLSHMKQATVRTAHRLGELAPLRIAVGDEVQVCKRDIEFPEFVFVTAADGSGWVPARNLSDSTGVATVRVPYDTTELPTSVGDVVEIVEEDRLGGWLWCRSSSGRLGWVPAKTLDEASGS